MNDIQDQILPLDVVLIERTRYGDLLFIETKSTESLIRCYDLYTNVALKEEFPRYGFRRGDISTIVDHHQKRSAEEDGYSFDVFNATGQTITVVVVEEPKIEPLKENEVLHVRQLE